MKTKIPWNFLKAVMLCPLLVFLATSPLLAAKICIDPGHGGSDPGAVGYVVESDVNLDAANKLKRWLDLDTRDKRGGSGWNVSMTRTSDVYVSLSARVAYANSKDVDRFLSIHSNAYTAAAHGSETFCYYNGSGHSFNMRNKVQEELVAHGKLADRGVKTAGFYVTKYTYMPAVLTELGFVTNKGDSEKLKLASWRNEVTKGFLHALQRHSGVAAYTPQEQIIKIADDGGSNFTASSNWFPATWSSRKYGKTYNVRFTELTSDPATWTTWLPSAGRYKIYAWWTSWENRARQAPYIIAHKKGTRTVRANQTTNGGRWNYMGTYDLSAGRNKVMLSCWTNSGKYIVADAIKWELAD